MKRFIFSVTMALLCGVILFADAATKTITASFTWDNPTTVPAGTVVVVEVSNDNKVTWLPACTVTVPANKCTDVARPVGFTYLWRGYYQTELGNGPSSQVVSYAAMPPTEQLNLKLDGTPQVQ